MNTISGAWCKFTQWNAEDFAVVNNNLFFCYDYGADTIIAQGWDGTTDYPHEDNTELDPITGLPEPLPINGYGKQAFNYLKTPELIKAIRLMSPILAVNGEGSYGLDIDVDFENRPMAGVLAYSSKKALWDDAKWDLAEWDEANDILKTWRTINSKPGRAIAPKLAVTSSTASIQWIATGLVYEVGGPL
jgi:hypothetical protein